jgi:outer membrane murein-binding lipoprotein Lpp
VDRNRFLRFVRLAVAVSVLLLIAAAWAQLRLRTVQTEIDALASETSRLSSENDQLRKQVGSHDAVRQRIREEGTTVTLRGDGVGNAVAVVHLDGAAGRALLVVENLRVDASCAYQLRIVPRTGPDLLITFGVDPDGDTELLLDDLPNGITEFLIERGDTSEALLSGTT